MDGVSALFDDQTVVLQGGPSLLLQFLYPQIAARLAETGALKRDPMARLRRTAVLMAAVLREDPAAIERFRRIHRGVDPRQKLWVFATLIVTAIEAKEAVSGPIGAEQKEAYYVSTGPFAIAIEIPDEILPATYKALAKYYDRMIAGLRSPDGGLAATDEAVELVQALFAVKLHGVGAQWLIKVFCAGLLPEPAREAYGLRWGRTQRAVWRCFVVWVRWRYTPS